MINKLRTPLVTVAFKVNGRLPKEMQHVIEVMIPNLLQLLNTAYRSPESLNRFYEKINEFCREEMIDILGDDAKPQKFEVCDDWKRGLRTAHNTCTNCGGKH